MQMVSSPSKYGSSRQFTTYFTNNGTERYSISLNDNTDAKNFFYDAYVYLTSSSSMSSGSPCRIVGGNPSPVAARVILRAGHYP